MRRSNHPTDPPGTGPGQGQWLISILIFVAVSVPGFYGKRALAAESAERPVISVQANPRKITLGDEVTLLIKIKTPEGVELTNPPTDKTALTPFEIKSIEKISDTEEAANAQTDWKMILTVFELGEFNIPPIPLIFKNQSGEIVQGATAAIKIQVVPVREHPKQADDIRPIKGPISLDTRFYYAILIMLAAILLGGAAAVLFILRKRKQAIEDRESLLAPHERARLELERLRQKNWIKSAKIKEFYTELADILRRYLQRGFGVDSLDRTSYEILFIVKEKGIDAEAQTKMKHIFENADLVKFAKYTPPGSLADDLMMECGLVIDITIPRAEPPPVDEVKK